MQCEYGEKIYRRKKQSNKNTTFSPFVSLFTSKILVENHNNIRCIETLCLRHGKKIDSKQCGGNQLLLLYAHSRLHDVYWLTFKLDMMQGYRKSNAFIEFSICVMNGPFYQIITILFHRESLFFASSFVFALSCTHCFKPNAKLNTQQTERKILS